MAYLGAPADDAAAAHCHGIATAVVAGAGCFPYCYSQFFVSVRPMFLSHPGHFVYHYILYRVLVTLCVYRVAHQLIFELDLF